MAYKEKAQRRAYQRRWHAKRKLRDLRYIANRTSHGVIKCARCPETDPDKLEKHHLNPDDKVTHKTANRAWKFAKRELDKCIILCRRCHGRETRAKLTGAQVAKIKASRKRDATLARSYGVSRYTIRDIRLGRTWKDISPAVALTSADD